MRTLEYAHLISQPKTLVIKVGSALLVGEDGRVRRPWLEALAQDMASLRAQGHRLVLVSSGAIRVGLRQMNLRPENLTMSQKQAAAALGQVSLAQIYANVFEPFDWAVGQMLLTAEDTEERRRYLNARQALDELLKMNVLPLINENDSVSTGEIRFGDNDRLAARVSGMIGAKLLFLLSDIDGLYTANPREDANARHVPLVEHAITPQIEKMAGVVRIGYSSGGMVTKLKAAQISMSAGCDMIVADGRAASPLSRLAAGERFTLFRADETARHTARNKWLSGHLKPQGRVFVDQGAKRALSLGKSLLPAGVVSVEGRFSRGDVVAIVDIEGNEVGRGLVQYDAADADKISGKSSTQIEIILGFTRGDNLIHTDDLAMYDVKALA